MKKLTKPADKAFQKRAGRCLIVFLIIMMLLSLGAIWIVTKVSTIRQEKIAEEQTEQVLQNPVEHDWETIADSLISKYQGRILSVLQLNHLSCRVSISPNISDLEAVELAEGIGRDIKNYTAGAQMATPSIYVFINGDTVAVARHEGPDYIGEISR